MRRNSLHIVEFNELEPVEHILLQTRRESTSDLTIRSTYLHSWDPNSTPGNCHV